MPKKILAALLFVTACGNSPSTNQPDAGSQSVAAAVVSDGDGPIAGVEVVFVNPDGKVAADVKTDANGRAQATIQPGASVTANYHGLTTVLGLQPGDGISFGPNTDPTPGADDGSFTVKFPPATGAASYQLITPCSKVSGAASPLALPNHSSCGRSGSLLLLALDSKGAVLQYATADGVTVTKGGTLELPAKTKWNALDSFTANLSGIDPAKIAPVDLTMATSVGYLPDHASVPTSAAAAAQPLKATLGLASSLQLQIDDAAAKHHQTLLQPIGATDTGASIDLSKDLLAWVTGASYDAAKRTATVTVTAGDTGNLLEVDLAYGAKGAWHVFGPAGASLTLPQLPASLAALAPQTSDSVTASAQLIDIDGQKYDALRGFAADTVFHYAGHPEVAAVQRIRISK